MKSLRLVLLCLITCHKGHMLDVDGVDAELLAYYYTLCPYNNFCQSPKQKEILNDSLVSCCETCACSPDCFEVGNCCPDYQFVQTPKLKYPCKNISPDYNENHFFHVINDCKNSSLAELHPRCLVPEKLEDLAVVSDQTSGIVYKNKHCAICHNVHDYRTWDLRIGCNDFFQISFNSVEHRNNHIYQNRHKCHVFSEPPDSRTIELSRCFLETLIWDTCNLTMLWDYYDEKIFKACHENNDKENTLFRHFYQGSYVIFANIYCFICNMPKTLINADVCEPISYQRDNTWRFKMYTAIVDMQESEDDSKTSLCTRSEIWDNYSKICRPIFCPGGTMPNYGDCKSILKFSEGAPIKVLFTVTVDRDIDAIWNSELLDFLEEKILQKIGNGCEAYGLEIRKVVNSALVLLKVDLSSTKTCAVHDVLSRLNSIAIEGTGIQLIYQTKLVKIKVILRLVQSVYDANLFSVILASKNKQSFEISHIFITSSIFTYCPQIQLSSLSEIELVELNTATTQVNESEKPESAEKVQYMCVDTYFKARRLFLNSSSSAPHVVLSSCLFMFVCQLNLQLM